MSDTELKFTVEVPGADDAGFIGFLDDMMNVVDLVDDQSMTPEGWGALMSFVEGCLDADDPHAAIRSLSMPQMLSIFEQIVEAVNTDPKGE